MTAKAIGRRSFLYSDVAAKLRARIARGTYRAGQRLPSLAELMGEFEVSAITIRRALSELAYEGLVRGHQGLGVFVKEKPKIHRVLAGDPDHSIGQEIARAGFTPRLRELDFGQVAADETIAIRLGIARGAPVYVHRKLTYADDEPVALHILYLRPKIARQLQQDLTRDYIFRVLKTHWPALERLEFSFSSTALTEEQSRLFELPAGQPMLRVDFTVKAKTGATPLAGITLCRADRFVFEIDLPCRTRRRE